MSNETSTCKEETACNASAGSEETASENWARPHYDVDRNDETFGLRIYVPGANKSSVDISVDEGLLTVTAKRNDAPSETWRPLSRELTRRDYKLEIRVPEKVDVAAIEAKVEDGILLLTLPIREADKPRTIEIN